MKISKKIMTAVLVVLLGFGVNQAISPIKAHALTSTQTKSQKSVSWTQDITLKLRAKGNYFYKALWPLQLVRYSDGTAALTGSANIPSNLTFDDVYIFGLNNRGDATEFRTNPKNFGGSAANNLDWIMKKFNACNLADGVPIFIHSRDWDDTVKFPSKNGSILKYSNNDYTNGYRNIDRWSTGFYIRDTALQETPFHHKTWIYEDGFVKK